MNRTHLDALQIRRSHELSRLNAARTEGERELRRVWLAGIDKEIASELKFLDLGDALFEPEMTDDEILAALTA